MVYQLNGKIENILRRILGIVHINASEELMRSLVQFIKFGIIGVSNTVISYVLNVLVLLAMRPYNVSWDYILGNLVAFFLSVLWSFYWNSRFVFTVDEGQQRNTGKALLKTYISYGFTGIILTNILSSLWISIGISKFIAPLINLVVSVPLNFIINKLWAFRTDSDKSN